MSSSRLRDVPTSRPEGSKAQVGVNDDTNWIADTVTGEAIRRLAYAYSLQHPEATAEENWLAAEAIITEAAAERERHEADRRGVEARANLLAKIEMAVFGHP